MGKAALTPFEISMTAFLTSSKKKIIVAVIILIGLGALFYVPGTWLWSYIVQRHNPAEFERELVAASSLSQEMLEKLRGATESEKLMQLAREYKSQLVGEQTIARLEIPAIGLNDIVVEGSDEAAFRKGPGHLEETALPGMQGNFAIAGDRVLYGGPFLNLDDINPEDEILVHMPYGEFSYRVINRWLTAPEDVSVLNAIPGSDLITLITCDPLWDTSRRLIVQGRLVEASLREDPTP